MKRIITIAATVAAVLASATPALAMSGKTGRSAALDAAQSVAVKINGDGVPNSGAAVGSCTRLSKDALRCSVKIGLAGGHGLFSTVVVRAGSAPRFGAFRKD